MANLNSILLLDFFLPRLCVSCNSRLEAKESIICSECNSKLERADTQRIEAEFERKFYAKRIISEFCSAYVFYDDSVLQNVIHNLKYEHNYHCGKFLGIKSAEIMHETIKNWGANLIVPVPLHSLRKAERGFNQSAEIARGISKELKIPYLSKVIRRKRYTQTQTNFNLAERRKNVQDAFSANNIKKLKGKRIIIVDDVITTGATVTECGSKLLAAGAEKVFALSVAVAA